MILLFVARQILQKKLSCWKPFWVLTALLLFSNETATARQLNHRSENEWTSTQKSSLGNIGVLSENFVDQFFADPSFQARKKNAFDLQILSVNGYFTDDFLKTREDVQSFVTKLQNTSGSGSGLSQGVETLEFVASLTGRRVEAGASIQLIAARFGRFTLVPYLNAFAKAHIDVPSWPEAQVIVDQYSALGLGYSHPLGSAFDLGINLRPGFRVYLEKEISASSIDIETPSSTAAADGSGAATQNEESGLSDGFTPRMGVFIPVDMAVGYNSSPKLRFNLVARNVYGGAVANMSQSKSNSKKADAPPDYKLHLSTGATLKVFEDKTNRIRLASEFQDVLNIGGMDDFWLRWQWGVQYLYNLAFRSQTTVGVNAGLQSGYPALGLLLDLFLFKIEAALFVFEGGGAPGQNPIPAKSFRIFSEISF